MNNLRLALENFISALVREGCDGDLILKVNSRTFEMFTNEMASLLRYKNSIDQQTNYKNGRLVSLKIFTVGGCVTLIDEERS